MNNPVYDVDYFIAKFEALKDQEVGESYVEMHCASWHCGIRTASEAINSPTAELTALGVMLEPFCDNRGGVAYRNVFLVNDGIFLTAEKLGKTPRARILAALREIKSKEAK